MLYSRASIWNTLESYGPEYERNSEQVKSQQRALRWPDGMSTMYKEGQRQKAGLEASISFRAQETGWWVSSNRRKLYIPRPRSSHWTDCLAFQRRTSRRRFSDLILVLLSPMADAHGVCISCVSVFCLGRSHLSRLALHSDPTNYSSFLSAVPSQKLSHENFFN